ncbi:SDR family NAD(P)-dependent oxidoreductase [Piscinibacter sakaiensis]|uniref:Dehydrogenase with different specificities n=1 Tax=Piscinibacter sakaiensis TaxID=1547922 RepID=A0A0K8P0C8_PISS1|nr:SDR family NAD(P)-dependent oxidoreductase [Piscinibacter sakaiensis]GAP35625.1 dehydrogenase with different specificities [Piscinibacter sakaiensis]
MTATLHIVTGASRGLGAAIAQGLLAPGATLLCIARGRHPTLADEAARAGAELLAWTHDLADPVPVAERLQAWLAAQAPDRYAEAALVNNAGVVGRIGPVDACSAAELSQSLRVGLEATLLLSAAFLAGTAGWSAGRRILNISSGLGRRAMAGSAVYCAAKAGMDHLSRAMALDEVGRPNGARIVSLAPGVIDTDMQAELRGADPAGFPDQGRFVALKQGGQLSSPADAAARVLAFLRRPDFGQDPVADVREA